MPIAVDDEFPDRLKALRARAELTQQQLADMAGVDRRQIAGYERGESKPRANKLYSLAKALGVSPKLLAGKVAFTNTAGKAESATPTKWPRAFPVRLTEDTWSRLKESADHNHRSLSAEITARLEESLEPPAPKEVKLDEETRRELLTQLLGEFLEKGLREMMEEREKEGSGEREGRDKE